MRSGGLKPRTFLSARGENTLARQNPRPSRALRPGRIVTMGVAASGPARQYLEREEYRPPVWANKLALRPRERICLAQTPTPIHKWYLPGLPDGIEVYVKRDDLTGMQMSGNKVRKLEFLMAEAEAGGYDSVITIGGIQSNHCRATAVAARLLGMDCHLILRNSRTAADSDPGLCGNLLVERMIGAHVHQCTKEEYQKVGSMTLGAQLVRELEAQGKKPYLIPVGGSNSLGTWGYLALIDEILNDVAKMGITDVASACGSGATSAGLALGARLSRMGAAVHAYAVCDNEAYFYDFCDNLLEGLGATAGVVGADARGMMRVVQCKGAGYAISRDAELRYIQEVALATGILLDPVYSGKAVFGMVKEMQADPEAWSGRKVLFVHTGGLLGMYEKEAQLLPLVEGLGREQRMRVEMP